jgi:hypothetical protein
VPKLLYILVYIFFLRLLYGAGRFICLLAVYVQFVDGSPSIISAALIPAVRGVSGCRACLCGNRNMYCGRIGVIIWFIWNSVVSTATSPKAVLRNRASMLGTARYLNYPFLQERRPAVLPTQSPNKYIPWLLPHRWIDSGVKLIAYLHPVRRLTINGVLLSSPSTFSGLALDQIYLYGMTITQQIIKTTKTWKQMQSIAYANHRPVTQLQSVFIYVLPSISTIHRILLLKNWKPHQYTKIKFG